MKSIALRVLDKKECDIPELLDVKITDDLICTTFGACLGDSGGPLVQNISGVMTLVGVTSSGSVR